ncbi:hypothetical protein V8F06_010426 [Rhypophila decipiens]
MFFLVCKLSGGVMACPIFSSSSGRPPEGAHITPCRTHTSLALPGPTRQPLISMPGLHLSQISTFQIPRTVQDARQNIHISKRTVVCKRNQVAKELKLGAYIYISRSRKDSNMNRDDWNKDESR